MIERIVVEMEIPGDLLQLVQAYSAIILSALLPIYTGCQASLKAPKTRSSKSKADDVSDSESDEEIDAITSSEALFAPLFASVALGGLFLAFKYLDPAWINYLFGLYFGLMGAAGLVRVSQTFLS